LAGIDSPADWRVASRFVKKTGIAKSTFVVHDSISALYAATQGKPGIIVNSGTGSFAAGVNSAGKYARAGGYGYLISDEGSAFDIGRRSLVAAFRSLDGRAPPTKLTTVLKRAYGVEPLENLLTKLYTEPVEVDSIAGLARLVAKEAPRDMVCDQILREAGDSLAELVCSVARELKMTDSKLVVATMGGSFKAGYRMVRPFRAAIRRECRRVRFSQLRTEPAEGAYRLAASILREGTHASQQLLHSPFMKCN